MSSISKKGITLNNIYNQKGFTLIEMSIVLIVIGLILGAVVKGNDILQSAKQKKFYTTFVRQWEQTIVSYYDRTGRLLADGTANGGTDATENSIFDDYPRVTYTTINKALKKVGLPLPPAASNSSNNMQYRYTGPSGTQTITMYLCRVYCHVKQRNVNGIFFPNMPADLAIAIDTMVDGQADPNSGAWRQHDPAKGPWPDASTNSSISAFYEINLP